MKNLYVLLFLLALISCESNEEIIFRIEPPTESRNDFLQMVESTNISKIPEDSLRIFLLPYEQLKFEIYDSVSQQFRLEYNDDSNTVYKNYGEIFRNDTFRINVILRDIFEEGYRNYKLFLRTINKHNYVIDNFELAAWSEQDERFCHGLINRDLELTKYCSDEFEQCFVNNKGEFESKPKGRIFNSQALEGLEYTLNKFNLKPIGSQKYEVLRIVKYSSFQYGKAVEFSKIKGQHIIKKYCYSNSEYAESCEQFEKQISEKKWDQLIEILNEFDFWTEDAHRKNMNVLDGNVYFLEGKLLHNESKQIKKRFLSRGSPFYDKIGSLCEILFKYEQS